MYSLNLFSYFNLCWLMHQKLYINPLTPKISLVILLTVCQTVLGMLVGESGIRSTYYPLIDIFIYSHHFST